MASLGECPFQDVVAEGVLVAAAVGDIADGAEVAEYRLIQQVFLFWYHGGTSFQSL